MTQLLLSVRCLKVVPSWFAPIVGQKPIVLIGIMEKNMETTIIHWGYIGIVEKKMETTIIYWGSDHKEDMSHIGQEFL